MKDRSWGKCSKRSKQKGEKLKGTEQKCSMALISMYCISVVEEIRVWEPLYYAVVHSGSMSLASFIKCSQAGGQKIPKSQCWFLLVLAKG